MKTTTKREPNRAYDVGKRLRAIRQVSRKTQTEFSAVLGISQSHLSNLERGFVPSMRVLIAIAGVRVYEGQVNLNWLLTGKGTPDIVDAADWQLAQQIQALDNDKKELFEKLLSILTKGVEGDALQ